MNEEWKSTGGEEKARFEEQDVEKMAAELKEVIEKATPKKQVTVRGSKGVEGKIGGGIENVNN
jgi:hypothetical protein